MPIEWKVEFLTGLDEIDAQHHYFFRLIKKIERFESAAGDQTSLLLVLLELRRYAAFHFASEELLMETYGFGGLPEHKKTHRALADHLQEHIELSSRSAASLAKLKMFLYSWFAAHTTHDDQIFAGHVKAARELPL